MTTIQGLPLVHPGEVLREDVIPATGLSKTAFAAKLGITREALHNVLSGRSGVSTMLALRLAKLLGTTPQMWLNLQQAYDLGTIGKSAQAEIARIDALEIA